MLPGPPCAVGTLSAPLETLEKSGLAPASVPLPAPAPLPLPGVVLAPLWTLEKSGFLSLLMTGRSRQWMCGDDGGTRDVKAASRRRCATAADRAAPAAACAPAWRARD